MRLYLEGYLLILGWGVCINNEFVYGLHVLGQENLAGVTQVSEVAIEAAWSLSWMIKVLSAPFKHFLLFG